MASEGKNGVLRGVAHPSAALRSRIGQLYGPHKVHEVEKAMDDLVSVDVFAKLLTVGINEVTSKDGRLDTKDLAAFVLRKMREGGKL